LPAVFGDDGRPPEVVNMSALDASPPVSSLLDTVHQIEPVLRAHAEDAERERRLPDAVVDAMRARGLYRLWRPRAFGGLEVDPMTAFQVIAEVSRVDSAAAWNLQMKLQLAATYAVAAAVRVVDLVHKVAGTTGIRDEHRFQRYFRDVHTIEQHAYVSAVRYESGGQYFLGAPIEWPFYAL
jgi:alkylation response protein AidB-like acyl-CoA dehydrogenase